MFALPFDAVRGAVSARSIASGMSSLRFVLPCLLLSLCPAHAQNGKASIKCNLEGTGIPGVWDIVVDTSRNVYSARVGDKVLATNQPAEPILSFAAITPQVKGMKLTLNLSPSQYWLVIDDKGAAATSSMSGSFYKRVGQCDAK